MGKIEGVLSSFGESVIIVLLVQSVDTLDADSKFDLVSNSNGCMHTHYVFIKTKRYTKRNQLLRAPRVDRLKSTCVGERKMS